MTAADYVVVGSGLTGAVIARLLADAGREVLVVDRRSHLGGNVHDAVQQGGIRVHTYGPHYFRTNSEAVWRFVNRFADFYRYEAVLASYVGGRYERWPVADEYIRRTVGEHWQPGFTGSPTNFEEASLAMMPESVYRSFVKGYTEKQWGVRADALSADLAGRFDVRANDDPRLKRHRHQGIPVGGYAHLMGAMLAGLPVLLGRDFLEERSSFRWRRGLVFTGPIDEYFGFSLGRLHYRGQERQHTYLPEVDQHQPFAQVNNPDPAGGPHVRTIEWTHILSDDERALARGTLLTRETPKTPTDPDEYEYPFPDAANRALYQRYRAEASAVAGLLVCGRLGEYRYYDMDQAIARAMLLAKRLLEGDRPISRPAALARP
ncbi:MAG: UDP-galactopyranose mutase [uncultured Acidimicrobiales bacterium]|uniref:UDP-galactopyranose mutase n=1 Tax=uncultured Acidimicrobiales bacterium TaxID=310071 RepID=A0A6J4HTC3_9ACTN|nr:MAG: UDP-galactopyranose mutase [uncultured Acidimicrobiales bacterium]